MFESLDFDKYGQQVIFTIVIVATSLLLGFVTYRVTYLTLRKVLIKMKIDTHEVLFRIKVPMAIIFMLTGFFLIVPFTNTLISDANHLNHFVSLVIVFSVAWLLIQVIAILKHSAIKKYDINISDNLKARKVITQYNILERVSIFMIILLAVGIGLMTFDSIRRIGVSLLASAGIAGIILGFAAQRLIATILAGLQIAITQPIRFEDVVIVENEWGWIEEITLTYVVVRIWDKRRLVLPTTYFIEKPFQNWTRTSADILGTVFLYADYRLPVDAVREELQSLLKKTDLWDGKVGIVQVTNATEKTMELRILVSATTSPRAWDLRVYLREHLIAFMQQKYPHCLPKSRVAIDEYAAPFEKKKNQAD